MSYGPVTLSRLENFSRLFKVADDGCWVWLGTKTSKTGGYGQFSVKSKAKLAHRVIYTAFYGPVEPKLQIDHLCRNRLCVNPKHLEAVTASENVKRGLNPTLLAQLNKKLATEKTHCKNGHEYPRRENNSVYRCGVCRKVSLDKFNEKRRLLRSLRPKKARVPKTHCKRDHELAGRNLYITPDNRRQCRTCQKARSVANVHA